MKTLYTILVSLLFAGGSPSAVAQMGAEDPGEAGGGSLFESLDRNGDGVLDQDEAGSAGLSGASFDEADTDADGAISQEEFDQMRNPGTGPQ